MPDFNFNPSISEVRFFRHYYGEDELQPIYNENAGGRAFELVMKLAISGLNYLNNPVSENSYVPFYLNIITYTQRGMRDIVTHGLITEYCAISVVLLHKFWYRLPFIPCPSLPRTVKV